MCDKVNSREKYEWTRIWWEAANDPSLPRILLIGDSITAGYRPYVNEMMKGNVVIDQLATSNAINDPLYMKQIVMMLDEYKYKAIHFNNGLHGWHLTADEYVNALTSIIKKIQMKQYYCRLVIATSTPITIKKKTAKINPERDVKIKERNSAVMRIASDNGIAVNDLYSHIVGKSELRSEDGSHYKQKGYRYLAEKVVDCLKPVL